ncbi:MAG: serine/threonine protein phosphatase [Oxalobacteraceae bacterium]|nr:MAG: serine/threonine protein phosphatase [Oxalobacteraceae bacterium]
MLTIAFADVHGRSDLLQGLLKGIAEYVGDREHQIISLGDYVDRGPDSKGVLDILMSRPDIINLRGNHEAMMLEAKVGGFSEVRHFIGNGGDATCASFGVQSPRDIPQEYFDWILSNTRLYHEDARRVFVHAGVGWREPDMTKQPEMWLLWIREGFLERTQPFFKYIVHGHTPYHDRKPDPEKPEILSNRCNLDTAAFFTGILTAAVFDDTQDMPIGFLQAVA